LCRSRSPAIRAELIEIDIQSDGAPEPPHLIVRTARRDQSQSLPDGFGDALPRFPLGFLDQIVWNMNRDFSHSRHV
jgi:hypothetical protein